MDLLGRLQRKIFAKDARNRPDAPDAILVDPPSFAVSSIAVNATRPWALPYLFEGDIILTPDQMNNAISYAKQQLAESDGIEIEERPKRTLISNPNLRWNSFPIPFTIARGVNRTAVLAGIKLWQDATCITFQENGNGRNALQYIFGSGCYSNIGMIGGVQQVSIGQGCDYPAIVGHETGHALGFYHEQARFDRDSYVQILTQNIQSGLEAQFTKQSPNSMITFGVPYDYGSVMHYDPYSFSRNNQPTIQTIDFNYQDTIGQRIELSFNDVKKINFAYCNSTCSSRLPCQNGGYTDPKTCNTCRCPSGLTGTYCDTPIRYQNSNCGTLNLNATGTRATLSQSGFGYCNFIIQAPVGQRIAISVDSIRFNGFTPCESSYVEIKYGWDIGNTGARFCSSVRTRQFVSATNTVLVLYRNLGTGSFSITYSAVSGSNGGGQTTQPPQTTTTRPWWLTTTRWCGPWGCRGEEGENNTTPSPSNFSTPTPITEAPAQTTEADPIEIPVNPEFSPSETPINPEILTSAPVSPDVTPITPATTEAPFPIVPSTEISPVNEHLESFDIKMTEAKIEAYKMILGIADDFQNSMSDVIEKKRSLLLQKIDELVTKKRSNKKQ
uniref:EGF-like domain-containing protein n=2 Tax=Panagrolaimus sp. PS1159 TaxID=55785 RepID=A0AC35FHC2_9BILA